MSQSPAPENTSSSSWPRIVVVLLIIAGVLLTVVFGIRTMRAIRMLHRPPPRPAELTDPEMVRGWMTLPYISRAYQVPERLLWEGIGISETGNRHKNLSVLEKDYGNPKQGQILNKVKEVIRQFQATHPTPPVPPKPPGAVPTVPPPPSPA